MKCKSCHHNVNKGKTLFPKCSLRTACPYVKTKGSVKIRRVTGGNSSPNTDIFGVNYFVFTK
jgi:hypothetical protein